jgi:L-histidine Nalpha-methyltransferase
VAIGFVPSYSRYTNFALDVLEGLMLPQKQLKPVYFYDEHGSRLFEQICLQPEYYPTRTELGILKTESCNIIDLACKDSEHVNIIELGSGSSFKTRILFRALVASRDNMSISYFPIDVSSSALVESANTISGDFPSMHVEEIVGDYDTGLHTALKLIDIQRSQKKIILFLGSSIGNMNHNESTAFLQSLADCMNCEDLILIGFDLNKDRFILERAYNDKAGVTAQFNLNLLGRINKELGGKFDLDSFSHKAFYNANEHRIEMHLVSQKDQRVRIEALNEHFFFSRGETIHTENSYKYSRKRIESIAIECGLRVKKHFTDPKSWYDLCLLENADA